MLFEFLKIVLKYFWLGKIIWDSQDSKMTLNDPRSYLNPSPLSVGGTCKYDMTPVIMLCYVAKGILFWVVLTSSGHPFKSRAEHFLWVVTEEETRHVPAGLEESKLLCCELPGREVVSGC